MFVPTQIHHCRMANVKLHVPGSGGSEIFRVNVNATNVTKMPHCNFLEVQELSKLIIAHTQHMSF